MIRGARDVQVRKRIGHWYVYRFGYYYSTHLTWESAYERACLVAKRLAR